MAPLRESHRSGKPSFRELRRKKGYDLLNSGTSKAEIARKLDVDWTSVNNWAKRLAEKGYDSWRDTKQKGRPDKLSSDQKKRLKEIIDNGPREYGLKTDLWTLKRVADVILREFGVLYNTTHVWRVLRSLGYSAQIPLATAMEKNPEYVKEWLEKEYPEHMKEAHEHHATILFQDESGMQSRPNVRKTWSLRGKRSIMKVREKRDRISISSAVSTEGYLYFMIREGSMNEDDIMAFLDQLLSEIHGFLYIFWDNIMIHRSKKVKEYLGVHKDRLITRRIPAYSPEFNPDEFVWNALKYQELPNFCPTDMDDLKSTATETMNKLKSNPGRMRKLIRGSKLPLPA